MTKNTPAKRSKRPDSSITHAKHDPATALASLFRPITKGRRPGGLQIDAQFNGMDISFLVWRALDTRDQSVLLAAIGMAGMDNQELHADVSGEKGQQLWLDLNAKENAVFDRAVVVTTTRYALIHAAGLDDKGQNYQLLEDCLTRLSMVGSRAKKAGYQWSMNLLSYAISPDGSVNIALNGRFAKALGGQYVKVSLLERRRLPSEPAQLAHAWLSAWCKVGNTQKISLDRLAEKVWGAPSKNASTNRTRRLQINKALASINDLATWQIKVDGRGNKAQALIKRSQILEIQK